MLQQRGPTLIVEFVTAGVCYTPTKVDVQSHWWGTVSRPCGIREHVLVEAVVLAA